MTIRDPVIYVAQDGLDGNAGTLSSPVGSIGEALNRVRAFPAGSGSKRIVVRGGNYYDVALTLTAGDSDLSIEAYEGESPILYGGAPVRNWERRGHFLVAGLEGVMDRSRDFRMLEVNGESRARARLPERGAYRHLGKFDVPWMSSLAGGWARQPTEKELSTLHYDKQDIGDWLDTNNAEMTIYHEWDESLVGLSGIDSNTSTVTFSNSPGHPPGAFADRNDHANEYAVWNIREGMKQPGQWFLDRTNGELVYWPLLSEKEVTVVAIAPSRERILHLDKVERLQIKGLTFACSTAKLVAGGFGATEVGAAIYGDGIRDVAFENVTVRHTGGWAIQCNGERIRLEGCHIHHTGAGGIRYKGEHVVVSNSRIHDIGLVYQSAVAVMSNGNGNVIRHNDIFNTPYSGIVETGKGTDISGNLFHNVMTFMKDGAAFYGSGAKGLTVSGNAMISDPGKKSRSYAYYLDELCEDGVVEDNLAVNARLPMLSHMTRNCSYLNNLFWDNGPQTISAANTFGLAFERNVLVADRIDIYAPRGNPEGLSSEFDSYASMQTYSKADGIVSMKNNVFYSRSGRITFHEYVHYQVIREFALETGDGNVFADPLIGDFSNGDVCYEPESPVQSLGIRSLSFTETGCSHSFNEIFHLYGGA